ncbi:MAG TPA: bifunctional phosphopantothenoylcysteine decarboxylase/phosphopantothenate--cysteine ligase CoaBC [Thermomicrobiales bacterium]|nr:bifunctional phosphopantothenoylcysteine decarboxylase/phosphopantothenate--cysteine ligase CoaBC [Thermomicrobiales bacterium]
MTQVPALLNRRVVLGVSGGIAAYKAADLASKLVQAGARVDVVMTRSATEFVRPLTFEALTKRPVHSAAIEGWSDAAFGHITLADEADILVIAPATANTIARLAQGAADDMLTVTHLSATPRGVPLLVAPAMEHNMYHHPATQANLRTLQERGAWVVGPEPGRLASGAVGDGRLAVVERILAAIEQALGATGPLAGRRFVVTAGATREALDPIRLLTNRSTGKMGYSVAKAAIRVGAGVTLITAPTEIEPVYCATTVSVESALSMRDAVAEHAIGADVLIMAAAVADYRPTTVAREKIKKTDDSLTIELTPNPDILGTIETPGTLRIGFAAETTDHEANAVGKLKRKNLDLIVMNDARAAMGSDVNALTLYYRDGRVETIAEGPKTDLGDTLIARVADMLRIRGG